ncbi:ATP-dependent DNA helicase RecG [Jatrophihabitans lederbergiae]|uniref:ATP-dependent DNA helicase RecG n=1 Tax=Jatrophihabitans lederbergiae TaxID=3075547 RepID=A0ABU2J5Z4_9ACTN|nr:ATP-dependent DNA helicase RecG [Jatrophihabitans sp. DSM 44399]MDT0259909.1 ATP-dependent DNA helicase RecG [Jatrophihabitans sp. DSM 44399]
MATPSTLLRDVLGGKTSQAFEKGLQLSTAGDLLRHYPRRFNERGELTDLSQLSEGDEVTVLAEVESASMRRIPGRRLSILEVVIRSGRHQATLSFFNQQWRERELRPGRQGMFAGKVTRFRTKLQLNSPDYILMDEADDLQAQDFASALIPVYPATSGLPSWTIARCVRMVLDQLDEVRDPLTEELRARAGLMELGPALRRIHRPETMAEYHQARRRLAFDEAFGVQLVLAQRRHAMAANPAVSRPRVAGGLVDAFADRLPFTFTAEQVEIAATIEAELAAEHPMHRLLQGEVGSGKTVVALRAMLQVVDAGAQAALLAPTEVLAAQHAATVAELLGDLADAGRLGGSDQGTKVVLLTGSMSAPARRAALLDAASGAAGIVIGTHALIQDSVQFADLGLVVIDEQHRFGVEQRDALRGKASAPPHMLVMTATPIPRTVAMTVFGDLETSELHELPAGRKEITSNVVPVTERPDWLDRVWQRVHEEVAVGRQVFLVCPRIGEEEDAEDIGAAADDQAVQTASVLATYAELAADQLADLRLALLHGRMHADEKNDAMARFAAGEVDVLVATTVIEVGINVPNASLMVILDADRFGVSQLHQLRGRIGRGGHPGLCLMLSQLPFGHPSLTRLEDVAKTTDGFELAMLDLKQRREGDVLGAAQSGRKSRLKLLSLVQDEKLILLARAEARQIIEDDPTLAAHLPLQEFLWDSFDSDRADFLYKS